MAIAYRSHASTNIASIDGAAKTVVITKPSGLTAGDWMVAVIGISINETYNTPSGWTKLGQQTQTNDGCLVVYAKIADSADAAATNFTFTLQTGNGGSQDVITGCLVCGTGTAPVLSADFIDFGTDTDGGSTLTFTGGVNPIVADSFLIMGVMAGANTGGGSQTLSNYTIVTSNPTWTERMDNAFNQTDDYNFAVATAPRTESTATGNFSADSSGSPGNGVGVLLAIIETQNVTVSPTVISSVLSIQAPSVTGTATVSPAVIGITATVQAPTVTTQAPKWVNPNKSTSPSWVNPNKS